MSSTGPFTGIWKDKHVFTLAGFHLPGKPNIVTLQHYTPPLHLNPLQTLCRGYHGKSDLQDPGRNVSGVMLKVERPYAHEVGCPVEQ